MIYNSFDELKTALADHHGFAASVPILGDDGAVYDIPNPGLLDDDQMERWEELQFDLEQCDREPSRVENVERVLRDGSTVSVATTVPGDLKTPYRIDGELMRPSYSVRLTQVIFGDRAKDYKAAGGSGSQVAIEWSKMNREFAAASES